MPKTSGVFSPTVKVCGGERRIKNHVKPYATINVKPYVIIQKRGKILCEPHEGKAVPLVFDNKDLAEVFVENREIEDCEFRTMELEELAHMCRDPDIHFDKWFLLDHISQVL